MILGSLSGQGAMKEDWILLVLAWIGFLLLVQFPGKNTHSPRLFKVMPLIWALNALGSLLIIAALHLNLPLGDLQQYVSGAPVWAFYPILIVDMTLAYLLAMRHPLFPRALLVGVFVQIVTDIWGFSESIEIFAGSLSELIGFVGLEVLVAIYLFQKFSSHSLRSQQAD